MRHIAHHTEKQGENSEKVGKGKPPVKNRFKPGQSGNPKGRPPGESLTTKINRVLDEPDAEHGTKADALISMAIRAAENGDFKFFKEIIDRRDGKVPDRIANADGTNVVLLPIKLDGDKEST